MLENLSCFWSRLLSGAPMPTELHALALGNKEQVVADLSEILVEERDYAEGTVPVSPDERRQVSDHGSGGSHAPGVGELETLLREINHDVPPLVGRRLEIPGQVPRREHGAL